MTVYLKQLEKGKKTVDEQWKLMGGDTKGYLSLQDFHELFDKSMPKQFDRDIAMEMFRELDSDKDGRMSYKDFNDCVKF